MRRIVALSIILLALAISTVFGDGQIPVGNRNCPDPQAPCYCPTENDPYNPCGSNGGRPVADSGDPGIAIRVLIARVIAKINRQ